MGFSVDHLIGQNDDLLSVAATHARDVDALCTDVVAVIFPAALQPPTDAVIHAVTSKLLEIVGDLEKHLLDGAIESGSHPATWNMLAQSGFLRDADLLDFVLARVSEDRLEMRLSGSNPMLAASLLDHADANVADAAQLLLATDSLHRRSRGNTFLMLSPELLHTLCWRIVAAVEVLSGTRSRSVIEAARRVLGGYDEAQTAASAARKIVHFLGEQGNDELLRPEKSGIQLFVAKLAAALNVEQDHVLRLIDCGSSVPLIVLLAGVGLKKRDASACLFSLRGEVITSREAALFEAGYVSIDRSSAVDAIAAWSVSRAEFLTFGKR